MTFWKWQDGPDGGRCVFRQRPNSVTNGVRSEQRRQGNETAADAWERSVAALIPQGRPQTPEDMGALAVYLAAAKNLTGQAISLDGGIT